jgi:hypothetical protein
MSKHLKKSVLGVIAASLALSTAPAWAAPAKPTTAPESTFIPRAQLQLTGDRVNVTLINKTNANISFQAIGDTEVRTLAGRQTVTLRGLRSPVTLTLDRNDSGLLLVTPKADEKTPGTLEVTLDTTTDLGIDAPTLRVESNGSVFLY